MTDSIQHRSTPVPSLEALERDVALADRRAARRTAIITSALALLVLVASLGATYNWLKNIEEESDREISTIAEAYNQDRSVFVSRDGYLVDNRTHRRIKPLVKDKWISVAAFSAKGDIALSTEDRLTIPDFIKHLFLKLVSEDSGRRMSDEIFVFDPSGELVTTFRTGAPPETLQFAPDGNKLLSVPRVGPPTIWTPQGNLVATIKTEEPTDFAYFSPNGNYVLVFSKKGAATVWSTQGQLTLTIKTEEPIRFVAFSPNGNYLIAFSDKGSPTTIWSVQGQLVASVPTEEPIRFAAFSPEDNRTLVLATIDGTLLVWDIPTAKLISQIKGPKAKVLLVGFRSGAQEISVVYSQPEEVKAWDTNTGLEVQSEFTWTETIPRSGSYIPGYRVSSF